MKIINFTYFSNFSALIFFILISSCVNSTSFEKRNQLLFEDVLFDAVQKEIIYATNLPEEFSYIVDTWFNKSVKVSGLEGKLTFTLSQFNENITNFKNGKRIELSLVFNLKLENKTLSKRKTITGEIKEYSQIEGNFTLEEFDILSYNTFLRLVSKLSKELKLQI